MKRAVRCRLSVTNKVIDSAEMAEQDFVLAEDDSERDRNREYPTRRPYRRDRGIAQHVAVGKYGSG